MYAISCTSLRPSCAGRGVFLTDIREAACISYHYRILLSPHTPLKRSRNLNLPFCILYFYLCLLCRAHFGRWLRAPCRILGSSLGCSERSRYNVAAAGGCFIVVKPRNSEAETDFGHVSVVAAAVAATRAALCSEHSTHLRAASPDSYLVCHTSPTLQEAKL